MPLLNEDWTERWEGVNSWTVGDYEGNAAGVIETVGDANRGGVSWDVLDDIGSRDIEIVSRVYIDDGDARPYHTTRGSGTSTGNVTCYRLGLRGPNDELEAGAYVDGNWSTIGTSSFPVDADSVYWIRSRTIGNSIQLKAWADGESEPEAWNIDESDNSIPSDGFAGLFVFGSWSGEMAFERIGVGVGGADAPISVE